MSGGSEVKSKTNQAVATLLALTATTLFFGVGSAFAHTDGDVYANGKQKSRTDTIAVPQMQCGMCEERLVGALEKVAGISKVSADAEMKQVIVTYNPRTITRAAIEGRIVAVGYDTGAMQTTAVAQKSLPMCCRPKAGH